MKKLLSSVVALLLVPAVGMTDDLSAELSGNNGFVSLQTDGSKLTYNIMTNNLGVGIGAEIKKGNSTFVDLDPAFNYSSNAVGSVSGLDLADLEANPGSYTVVVEGADREASGKVVSVGESASGGAGPVADLDVVKVKAKAKSSGALKLRCKVRNRGPQDSAATSVAYYLSDDQVLSNDDTFVAEDGLDAVKANKIKSSVISTNAPSGVSGQKYVLCHADPFEVNDDPDLSNNADTSGRVNLP